MRKRRVGVTARSRQIEGSRVTGFLQIDTEMAAPLELRTPIGTCGAGEGRNQSADGSMATRARESTGRMQSEGSSPGKGQGETQGGRAKRAHEAPPHTPPGGKPPETPGPLSLGIHVPERWQSVKGSQAAQKRRALDRFATVLKISLR